MQPRSYFFNGYQSQSSIDTSTKTPIFFMASSSNQMLNLFDSHHETSVSEKLTLDNYMLWKAQVLSTVHGARVLGILDGLEAAPSKTIEIQKADKTKEIVEIRRMVNGWPRTNS
jgi:hypothetical protein